MDFITDYIDRRHPNSPKILPVDVQEADLGRLMAETSQSLDRYIDAMYCLTEGIIEPSDLPPGMVAI